MQNKLQDSSKLLFYRLISKIMANITLNRCNESGSHLQVCTKAVAVVFSGKTTPATLKHARSALLLHLSRPIGHKVNVMIG